MALKYYSYLHSCHFPSTNIFGYSVIDFLTTKYIWIFVSKFLEIRLYLNICSKPFFNICLSIFNENIYLDIIYASQNIHYRILFRGSMSEAFYKISSISDNYEYSNIQIKWPSNIICLHIRAISGVQIYSYIRSVNMLHSNIFRYSPGTYCCIRIYSDICSCHFYYICSSLPGVICYILEGVEVGKGFCRRGDWIVFIFQVHYKELVMMPFNSFVATTYNHSALEWLGVHHTPQLMPHAPS